MYFNIVCKIDLCSILIYICLIICMDLLELHNVWWNSTTSVSLATAATLHIIQI